MGKENAISARAFALFARRSGLGKLTKDHRREVLDRARIAKVIEHLLRHVPRHANETADHVVERGGDYEEASESYAEDIAATRGPTRRAGWEGLRGWQELKSRSSCSTSYRKSNIFNSVLSSSASASVLSSR